MGRVQMKTRKRGERPNGFPNDVMAPDGVPEYGWRKVRKGGLVKFAGCDFQDNALIPFIGDYVCIVATCYWLTDTQAWIDYPVNHIRNPICTFKSKPLPVFTETDDADDDEIW